MMDKTPTDIGPENKYSFFHLKRGFS